MRPFILLSVLAVALYFGWKNATPPASSLTAATTPTLEELQAVAATVRADEVVMYSTTECVYCNQAKGWLRQYGFAFTECNMSIEPRCETEFRAYGATGTPFLIVRGHQMKEGFDSEEFLTALR